MKKIVDWVVPIVAALLIVLIAVKASDWPSATSDDSVPRAEYDLLTKRVEQLESDSGDQLTVAKAMQDQLDTIAEILASIVGTGTSSTSTTIGDG